MLAFAFSLLPQMTSANVPLPKTSQPHNPTELAYLRHLITVEGVRPLPSRIEAIRNFPTPDSRSSLQHFLGMINFYYRFLSIIASRLEPLNAASVGRGKERAWTIESQDAFENAKAALTYATLLHHPQANAPTSITVDASDLAIGAQLEQLHNGYRVPIAFFSRKLSSTEMKYNTFVRELLAAYQAVRHFRHFVKGKPFTFYTDHKPLTSALSNNADRSPRQSCHMSFIAKLTSDI